MYIGRTRAVVCTSTGGCGVDCTKVTLGSRGEEDTVGGSGLYGDDRACHYYPPPTIGQFGRNQQGFYCSSNRLCGMKNE